MVRRGVRKEFRKSFFSNFYHLSEWTSKGKDRHRSFCTVDFFRFLETIFSPYMANLVSLYIVSFVVKFFFLFKQH